MTDRTPWTPSSKSMDAAYRAFWIRVDTEEYDSFMKALRRALIAAAKVSRREENKLLEEALILHAATVLTARLDGTKVDKAWSRWAKKARKAYAPKVDGVGK